MRAGRDGWRDHVVSIQAVAWALEQQIPAGPKLVLVALANHADHSTGLCWPSVTLIAHEASCSPRAVYRFVADLSRNGFVMVEKKRGKDGKQRSNNYWLLLDRLPLAWSAVPSSHTQDADEKSDEEQEIVSSAVHEDEPGDSVSPGEDAAPEMPAESLTPGVNVQPGDTESPGPSASGVTRQESSLEPSYLEPSPRPAFRAGAAPTRYDASARPTAIASAAAEEARRRSKPVFVIEGTRAFKAWQEFKTREWNRRIRLHGKIVLAEWHAATMAVVNGKNVRGWYFPTLFPPESPRDSPLMTRADCAEVERF